MAEFCLFFERNKSTQWKEPLILFRDFFLCYVFLAVQNNAILKIHINLHFSLRKALNDNCETEFKKIFRFESKITILAS